MILQIAKLWFVLSVAAHFTETPANVSVKVGENVIFRCSAENTAEPIVYSQWKSNTGSLMGYHQEGVLPGHQGRYSYIRKNAHQLHLKIENVQLDDDGRYECQILHPVWGPIRAKAYLNVLIPPSAVYFPSYQPNAFVSIREGNTINITCAVPNVKPEPLVTWYYDGHKMNEATQEIRLNLNKTYNVFKSLMLKPDRDDHQRTLTCEVFHNSTGLRMTAKTTLDVLFPPSDPLVSTLNNLNSMKIGDNVTVSCAATSGNPTPDVVWYLENRRLPGFSKFDAKTKTIRNEYTFTATSDANMAEYECRANNSYTSPYKSSTIRLKVEFPPTDVEMFGESFLRYGSSTIIRCDSLPSNPSSQISWKIDGREVLGTAQTEKETKYAIISSSNLTVHSKLFPEEKTQVSVECLAKNQRGSALRQHVIKFISPPKQLKISEFSKTYFYEGDIINMTCEAEGGNPLAELTWYSGNDKVFEASSGVAGKMSHSSLLMRLDRNSNGKHIKCEAINAAVDKPIIETRILSVYYPPRRVFLKPAEQEDRFFSGKLVRLVCGAVSSNPPAHISWKFPNNVHIQHGDISSNETTKERDFNVENVISFVATEDYDDSVVTCVASHPNWKHSMNATHTLSILYAPISLINGTVNVVISEGESFRENLTMKSNPPVSSWQWRKNGITFDHTIGRIIARGAVLSGRQTLNTDAGVYVLTATNSMGSTNITVNLVIEYNARITSISTPVVAASGETVLLECEADAEPLKPNMIKWFKNGFFVPSVISEKNKAVVRFNATQETSGKFICRADNGIGYAAESETFLLVKSAPRVHYVPQYAKTAGMIGGTAKARCEVDAVPNVDLSWEKDGQIIKGNNSKYSLFTAQVDYITYESILLIKNIVPDDYMKELKCIARNVFGEDSISIPIVFPTDPEKPSNLSLTNSTSNTISITWEPGFNGGSDQTFEIKYRRKGDESIKLVNTTHNNLRVSGLATSHLYEFQIRSINLKGFASSWTNLVIFSTLDQNGNNVAVSSSEIWNWIQYLPYLMVIAVTFMLFHGIVCCFLCNRSKKRKLREKTELVRAAVNGDVRQVQMYGTMTANNNFGCEEIDDRNEMSEDEQSVKTMIEVSPNGYMQPINPGFYQSSGIYDYQFHSRSGLYSSNSSDRKITYANNPYPEPPTYFLDSTSTQSQNSEKKNQPRHLSTFINPDLRVQTGPLTYTLIDGDLV